MKKLATIAVLLSSALLVGCHSTHSSTPKGIVCPDDIRPTCLASAAQAKQCIDSHAKQHLPETLNCQVAKVPGVQKFGGEWAWQSEEWNGMWVCGLCYGYAIKVACDPKTGAISGKVLTHEMGHSWLMTYWGDSSHCPLYDSCLYRWKEAREATGRETSSAGFRDMVRKIYDASESGSWVSVYGTDSNNVKYHIDFVVP